MVKNLESKTLMITSPIDLIESASKKNGKGEERKTIGSSGLSLRQVPTPLTKNNRKKFNRMFRDYLRIGEIIILPNGIYVQYEGHMQGRSERDRKTYYIQYSSVEGFNLSVYKKTPFSFPDTITFKDGVYNIGFMGVVKPRISRF